jgi:hypothetical protein
VIGFDDVVRIPLQDMPRVRCEFIDDSRIDRRVIGDDLDRGWPVGQGSGEERPRSRAIAPLGEQDVDDLAALIDRPTQVGVDGARILNGLGA